jgi:TonB-linked SusC/RagA family outer membrane protein
MSKLIYCLAVRLCTAFIFILFSMSLFAQKKVSGTVYSGKGNQPINGATVLVKGTSTGTTTGINGTFTISVPTGSNTLIVSYVGFADNEVDVSSTNNVNVTLQERASSLDEIVVTGYSSQKKKDITGAVAVVNVKDLNSVPGTNAENQLQGRAAGVTVISNNQPGSVASVRIRGFASFTGNDPLYIVDGVPVGSLLGINSEDIATFQILKDAASASIYGSRASNGVVIITTKRGGVGPARVSYSMYYGTQNPGKGFTNFLNPQEQADLTWLALKNSGQDLTNGQYGSGPTPILPDYILAGSSSGVKEGDPAADPAKYDLNFAKLGDPAFSNYSPYLIVKANKQGTNWYQELTRNAPIMNHNLTVAGGSSDKSKYMFSFNYLNQDGIEIENYYKRFTVRANTEFNVKDVIRIGENIQLYTSSTNAAGNNGEGTEIGYSYRIMPIIPVYNINGDFAGTKGSNLGNAHNPVATRIRSKDNANNQLVIFGNVYAEVDLTKHLTARTSLGGTVFNGNYYNYPSIEYENSENTVNTTYTEGFSKGSEWVWTNQLTYKNTFGNHNVEVLVGSEAIEDKGRQINGTRSGYYSYTNLNYITFSSANTTTALTGAPFTDANLYSLFGKVDYGYNDKYLASFVIRRDGSSRFGEANRYGVFPSGSVGWRISKEDFMKNISWLTDLKLRGSYGTLGNQRIDPNNQFTLFSTSPGASSYDINGSNTGVTPGFYLSFVGNTAGKWETNITTDVGFDASLFKGNTQITFDWYEKKTKDLLFPVEQPAVSGGTASGNPPFFNVASMKNTGIDISASQIGRIGGANGLQFNATLTFTSYRNKITNIANGVPYFDFDFGESNRIGGTFTRNAVGHPIDAYFGYVVQSLWQTQAEIDAANQSAQKATGDPNSTYQSGGQKLGEFRYKDINGDGIINDDDRTFFGNPNPDFSYGFNLNLNYKRFDLQAFFYGVSGKDAINYVKWWTDFYPSFQGAKSKAALYDSWTPDRPNATVPIQQNSGSFSTNTIPNSYYLENASYLRLKNLSLGYNIPANVLKKVHIDQFRVYVQATNVFTITKYSGLDPEIINFDDRSQGIDAGVYPTIKQYIVGAQVNF